VFPPLGETDKYDLKSSDRNDEDLERLKFQRDETHSEIKLAALSPGSICQFWAQAEGWGLALVERYCWGKEKSAKHLAVTQDWHDKIERLQAHD
jgi:hypothetical protein